MRSGERRPHGRGSVVGILDTAHMEIALRERNLNACLPKPAVNILLEVTFNLQPVVDILNPDT
jgi:hypothetical protein